MISGKASKKTKYLRLYCALTCTHAYLWIFTFEWKSNSASPFQPFPFSPLPHSDGTELVFSLPAVGEQLWNAARGMGMGEGRVHWGEWIPVAHRTSFPVFSTDCWMLLFSWSHLPSVTVKVSSSLSLGLAFTVPLGTVCQWRQNLGWEGLAWSSVFPWSISLGLCTAHV